MSKCSVWMTSKSNFAYMTRFCPKYCADATAGTAERRAARHSDRRVMRVR
jgi:hypothetical protein